MAWQQGDQMSLWKNLFVKNVAQNIFLSKLMHMLKSWIKWPKNVGYFCNFHVTAQSKQSHIGRKFAQSGHPAVRFSSGINLDKLGLRTRAEASFFIISPPGVKLYPRGEDPLFAPLFFWRVGSPLGVNEGVNEGVNNALRFKVHPGG
jgi:hypothetical protein